MVFNSVDLTDCNLSLKEFPFFDDENNIYIKSVDDKIVCLVTKNSSAEYLHKSFIHNIIARLIYPVSILFLLCMG